MKCYKTLRSKEAFKKGNYCEHSENFALGTRRMSSEPIPQHLSLDFKFPVRFRYDTHAYLTCASASLLNVFSFIDTETANQLHDWMKCNGSNQSAESKSKKSSTNHERIGSKSQRNISDVTYVRHLNKVLNFASTQRGIAHGYRLENAFSSMPELRELHKNHESLLQWFLSNPITYFHDKKLILSLTDDESSTSHVIALVFHNGTPIILDNFEYEGMIISKDSLDRSTGRYRTCTGLGEVYVLICRTKKRHREH